MGSDADADTSRTVVQAYVPAYQRDNWDEHAEQLGMSRSEFVKTMVQAGRSTVADGEIPDIMEGLDSDGDDDGDTGDLSTEIVELLTEAEAMSWEELLAALTDDIETRLDETLQELQESNQIRYSGRADGYVLVEGEQ